EQFMPDRLFDPVIRDVLAKVEVVSRDDFSAAYNRRPPEHHTRVIVTLSNDREIVGEAGGDRGDMADAATPDVVAAQSRELCGGPLGRQRAERGPEAVAGIAARRSLAAVPGE